MSTEAQLQGLLDRYVEHHVEHGRALPTEELCRGVPELREPLLRLIREYHELDRSLAPPAPLEEGQVVSGYQIQRLLGSGGMGAVYKAEYLKLGRTVAIKVLHPEMAADPERLQRFEQEARSASALNHPNIITVHDIDRHNGAPFIAMEYVQGSTLTALMDKGRLPLGKALDLAVQIADGLARAHSHGIVHRDLKPDNLMVTEDGLVKILDFGLAKLTEPTDWTEAKAADQEHPRTKEGQILGTAPYMSPEQAQAQKVDPRSDIFSFGSVLYEMVTGRRPFAGDSAVTLLAAIIENEPERAGSLIPSIPLELERVIQRALHKDPDRRFQSSADLKVALLEIKEELESGKLISAEQIMPSERASRSRVWPWLAGILAVVGLGLATWTAFKAIQPVLPTPRVLNITALEGSEIWPALSPDGKLVAFSWDGGLATAPSQIYVKLISSRDLSAGQGVHSGGGLAAPLQITYGTKGAYRPAWSPDGSLLAFVRGGSGHWAIYETGALGGTERLLVKTSHRQAPHLSWSPSGDQLAITDEESRNNPRAIYLLSREDCSKELLTARGGRMVAFSPDGKYVAFVRTEPGWRNTDLYYVEIASGKEKRLTTDQAPIVSVDWSPDGRFLIFSSARGGDIKSLWRIPRGGGEPVRLGVGEEASWISVSREGHRLVFSRATTDYNIWRVSGPAATEQIGPTRFFSSSSWDFSPHYSPGGSKVSFTTAQSGKPEIWVCNKGGENCQFLTPGSSHSWSPDGTRLAFTTTASKQFRGIGIIAAAGGFSHVVVENGWNGRPRWSRDGEWIYFQKTFRGDRTDIWKVKTDGEQLLQVTHDGGFSALESEDGRHLYYETRLDGGDGRIWKMPVAGGEASVVLERLPSPRTWSIWKGFLIYFTPEGESGPVIESLDLTTGEVTTVAQLGPEAWVARGLNVSPDGQRIIYANRDVFDSDVYLVEHFHVDGR